jgi:2-dehydropantoate 2-reductase
VTELRIGVLGPGAVGGLLAALVARRGTEIICIGTPSSSQTIASVGISIDSKRFGTFRTVVTSESDLTHPVDVLCVTVKATSLDQALTRISPELLGSGVIVPFLNGIEHIAILRKRFPLAAVIPATIRIETTQRAPGEIEQLSTFARIDLACGLEIDGIITQFVNLLSDIGFDVRCRDDERTMLWEKLGFLAPLALLTTAYDLPAGRVRSDHRSELIAVIDEITMVANADGATLDPADILLQLDSVSATMQSSMQRDARAGRPYEIEAVGGAIVRSANSHMIAVPATQRLVSNLSPS